MSGRDYNNKKIMRKYIVYKPETKTDQYRANFKLVLIAKANQNLVSNTHCREKTTINIHLKDRNRSHRRLDAVRAISPTYNIDALRS